MLHRPNKSTLFPYTTLFRSTDDTGSRSLKVEDIEAIRREVPSVAMASPAVNTRVQIIAGNQNWRTSVDRKSTRLNSSHGYISYAVFCLKKKTKISSTNTIRK